MNDMNTYTADMPEAAKISGGTQLLEASVPKLPPLSINNLTQVQLKKLIPALMKAVSSKETSTSQSHPCWWPPDIPWVPGLTNTSKGSTITDNMKAVVRGYYRHLGQENMLSCGKLTDWRLSLAKLQALQSKQAEQLHGVKSGNTCGKTNPRHIPFVGIYMCFFCSKEFVDKEEMRSHQTVCEKKPKDLHSPSKNCSSPARLQLFIPQSTLSAKQFMQKIDLVPLSKARKIRESSRKSTEVNTIDFSDPKIPLSPTTPKTPKLLISQLSRDHDSSSSCKRRLSLSCYSQKDNVSDTESTASSENEEHECKKHFRKSTSLFSIPVTSELGCRVLKHMVSDSATPKVLTNAEEFCKTPKKNKFADRLRVRENVFPVNFKPRRKYRFHHLYKFSKAQKEDFMKTVDSGLNKKSRDLQKSLPKCSVRLVPLTKRELKKYIRVPRKSKTSLNPSVSISKLDDSYLFPLKPILLTENIDKLLGLRKKADTARLSLMNVVSESANVEMLKQKVVVYRSLLTDLSVNNEKEKSKSSKKSNKSKSNVKKTVDKHGDASASDLVANKYIQAKRSLESAEKKKYCRSICVKPPCPQLTDLLDQNPVPSCTLSPSSSDSSSESVKSLASPLNIDIPSPDSCLSRFLLGSDNEKRQSNTISPGSVSIMTLSSEEGSLQDNCCMGCSLRKECRHVPVHSSDRSVEGEAFWDNCQTKGNLEHPETKPPYKNSESQKKSLSKAASECSGLQAGNKKQTRSNSSVSSNALTEKKQSSNPLASNVYSLRSNPKTDMAADKNSEIESLKKCKTLSESALPGKPKSFDVSAKQLQNGSAAVENGEPDAGDTVTTCRTLRSNSVSLASAVSTSDSLSRPLTRNSPLKAKLSSTVSLPLETSLTWAKRLKLNDNVQVTTRPNTVSERSESSCMKENSAGAYINSSNDEQDKLSDEFTRVDADILMKNVKSVRNLTSSCKQKPERALTRSKTENFEVANKRRKLDA